MSKSLIKQPIVWVETNEELDELCQSWEDKKLLAVDTEFMRSQTYYPIPGLFQINDGETNYLIDPTKVDDYFPLVEIFDNDNITKVFHSCSEDLEVFQHAIGCTPKKIFDTQIAGAFAGYGFSVGFANTIRLAMDVSLPKTETRSDWLARPLSQSQIYYAALDVEYLYVLARQLMNELDEMGRLDWAVEESESLVQKYFEGQDPDNSYLRIKSAWKLNARQFATLKRLSRWREDYAQELDQPRNRILKEHAVFDIARIRPSHIAQLRNIEGVTERMIKKNGAKIIDLVKSVDELPEDELPGTLPRPLGANAKDVLKSLKQYVAEQAETLSMPAEMLVRKKEYEALARTILEDRSNVSIPEGLEGWRKSVIAQPLLTFIKNNL